MRSFLLIRPDKQAAERESAFSMAGTALMAVAGGVLAVRWGAHPLVATALLLVLAGWGRAWLRRLYPDWPRSSDVIGTLALGDQDLIVTVQGSVDQVSLAGVVKAELDHNHIKGRTYAPRDIIHNGIAELRLTWRTGDQRSIKFLVEREEQLPALVALLRTLYRSGCSVRERMGRYGLRTVLLDAGRSYAEMQALKRELGVDEFR